VDRRHIPPLVVQKLFLVAEERDAEAEAARRGAVEETECARRREQKLRKAARGGEGEVCACLKGTGARPRRPIIVPWSRRRSARAEEKGSREKERRERERENSSISESLQLDLAVGFSHTRNMGSAAWRQRTDRPPPLL
jgi:hypothetical protein